MKEVWRENSKIKTDLTGITEFKHKVNIMLQNQMYLNMGSAPGAQNKFDNRKADNIWGQKDLDNKI
jgi:hypothetical protein